MAYRPLQLFILGKERINIPWYKCFFYNIRYIFNPSNTSNTSFMPPKVISLEIGGRTHTIGFDKKLKNTTPEYSVQVHDSLRVRGIDNFRFHVFGKNIVFPDGTKTAEEKTIKQTIASHILEKGL
jgi:hypothetical protein